ncbi:MAG: hypothetical protein ABIH40_03675 [Candidatus Omnitrophota bacterium]
MTKRLRQNMWLYIAPHIKGTLKDNGTPIVYDEREKKNLDPNNIDDKITIYERQVKEWFLNHALTLGKQDSTGFIILMIGISYIEGVEQYREGQIVSGNSRRLFKKGIIRIFGLNNVLEYKLDSFYEQVRCGLFHTGMTDDKVIINSSWQETIDLSNDDSIKINQIQFINTIIADFEAYITNLRNPTELTLRANFNQIFTVL